MSWEEYEKRLALAQARKLARKAKWSGRLLKWRMYLATLLIQKVAKKAADWWKKRRSEKTPTQPATSQATPVAQKQLRRPSAPVIVAIVLMLAGFTLITYGVWQEENLSLNSVWVMQAAVGIVSVMILIFSFIALKARWPPAKTTVSTTPPAQPQQAQQPRAATATAAVSTQAFWPKWVGTAATVLIVILVISGVVWYGWDKRPRFETVRSPNRAPLRTMEMTVMSEWSDAVMIPAGERIKWTRADRTVSYEVRTSTQRDPIEIQGIAQTSLIERKKFADTESVQFRTTDPDKKEVRMKIEFFPY